MTDSVIQELSSGFQTIVLDMSQEILDIFSKNDQMTVLTLWSYCFCQFDLAIFLRFMVLTIVRNLFDLYRHFYLVCGRFGQVWCVIAQPLQHANRWVRFLDVLQRGSSVGSIVSLDFVRNVRKKPVRRN